MSKIVSPISPFGIPTNHKASSLKDSANNVTLYTSSGPKYIPLSDIPQNSIKFFNSYKVLVSQTSAEHAGEPSKDGTYNVLTNTLRVLHPKEACTHSYILIGCFNNVNEASNLYLYLKTKFARFLLLLSLSSIHISMSSFYFVPLQDFTRPWTDADLYAKYHLTDEEIQFIESMIKPMD